MQQLSEEKRAELERRVHRSAAAQRVFGGKDGELVLKEIKAFCRGGTFIFDVNHPDPTTLAVNVGRRDVWQCIENMLKNVPKEAKEILEKGQQDD